MLRLAAANKSFLMFSWQLILVYGTNVRCTYHSRKPIDAISYLSKCLIMILFRLNRRLNLTRYVYLLRTVYFNLIAKAVHFSIKMEETQVPQAITFKP